MEWEEKETSTKFYPKGIINKVSVQQYPESVSHSLLFLGYRII
jgi:hypothetical protein